MAAKRPQVFAAYEQIIKNQLKTLPTPIQHQNNINTTRQLPRGVALGLGLGVGLELGMLTVPFPAACYYVFLFCAHELQLN